MEQPLTEIANQHRIDNNSSLQVTQFVTFSVGSLSFGVNVEQVQEIIRNQPITPVPLAPKIVRGVVNLRGQIITAIDMRALLKLADFDPDKSPMNVVIRTGGEVLSLLVDRIGDVVDVSHSLFETTPETVPTHISQIVKGIFKLEHQLLFELDVSSYLTN